MSHPYLSLELHPLLLMFVPHPLVLLAESGEISLQFVHLILVLSDQLLVPLL